MTRSWAWALWLLVTFGVLNAGGRHEDRVALEHEIDTGTWRATPGEVIRAVRAYLTNEGDVRRYLAYADALLGRPYESFYVRTEAEWRAAFARGENADPDTFPVVDDGPRRPYRDFLVEYPPAFFLFAVPPALVSADGATGQLVFASLMALLLTIALRVSRRVMDPLPASYPAWAALGMLLLGAFATHRFDAALALLVAIIAWAMVARRPVAFGAALGLAVATKIVPILALPIWAADAWRRRDRRALVTGSLAFAVVLALFVAPALALAGRGALSAITYQLDRPLQIESTAAALLGMVPGAVSIERSFGSTNVIGALAPAASALSTIALLAALAGIGWITWPRLASDRPTTERNAAMIRALVAALVAFMVCNRVFSPQYLVWILPVGVALSLRRGAMLAVLCVVFALTQLIYPVSYAHLEALAPWACALVLVRNGLLAWWGWQLLRRR
jgi:hypothetical protein